MQPMILSQGVLPLTMEAADAALDAIDFIAAAVRGYDAIDVTEIVRPIWRAHLAYWFPQLPPQTQQWYADAPQLLATIRAQWPLQNAWQRAATLQQWGMELPYMLAMVDPVLARAQAIGMQQAQRSQLDDLRSRATEPEMTDAEVISKLNSGMAQATQLQNFATSMTASTLNLAAAMSGRSGGWSSR